MFSEKLDWKNYAGVFLISAAALLFQVLLIRLVALSHSYHFAFLVISIALFGIAAAGTILAIKDFKSPLLVWSVSFSISAPISFFLSNRLIFDPFKAVLEPTHISVLAAYYIILGAPFLFFALIIGWLFKHHKSNVSNIYFWNLLGSATGAVSVLFLLPMLGLKTLFAPLALGLLASYLFSTAAAVKVRRFILLAAALSLLFLLLLQNVNILSLNVSDYKDLSLALRAKDSALLGSYWTVYGKTDLVSAPFHNAPGLSLNYKEAVPTQLGIFTDASFAAAIIPNQTSEAFEFANYLPEAVAAAIIDSNDGKSYGERKALILQPSSHYAELFSSLNYSVTVVEPNKAVAGLINRGNEQVTVIASDIRSFLAKNSTKFDLVVLPVAGSQNAGFFSLSENYALTKEAFNDYYNHLSEDGLLIITEWLDFPPRGAFKTASTLYQANIPNLSERFASFNGLTTITFVVSKSSFDEKRLDAIQDFTDKMGYDLVYLRKNFTPNLYNKFPQPYHYDGINRIMKMDSEFAVNYIFDISAVTDEKPFFSDFFKWGTVNALYMLLNERWQPFLDSGFLLWFLFLQAFVLALAFVIVPLLPYKRFKVKMGMVIYFFLIGLGFILVEIALIQKLAFFLGNITVSASLVLFSLLTFSGLGAFLSQKLVSNSRKKFFAVIIIICLLLLFYSATLQTLISQFLGLSSVVKLIVTAVIIAPVAFLMGFPFPTAIKAIDEQSVPWAFAVNGAASVLGSVLAVIIASEIGYFAVLIVAAVCYLLSLLVVLLLSRARGQTSLRL